MDISIHGVNRIEVLPVVDHNGFRTRRIQIESDRGERLEITTYTHGGREQLRVCGGKEDK